MKTNAAGAALLLLSVTFCCARQVAAEPFETIVFNGPPARRRATA